MTRSLIRVNLFYTAENPVLDGHLMNTLFRVIDEPILASGITAYYNCQLYRHQRPHLAAKPKAAISDIVRVMIDPQELIATCRKLVPWLVFVIAVVALVGCVSQTVNQSGK